MPKLIRLKNETYNRLERLGTVRDTFDSLVNKLIEDHIGVSMLRELKAHGLKDINNVWNWLYAEEPRDNKKLMELMFEDLPKTRFSEETRCFSDETMRKFFPEIFDKENIKCSKTSPLRKL